MAVPVNKNNLFFCPLLLPVSVFLFFLPVHFLVFEKWPKPSSNHGAPLHHQQMSGGAGQNVQSGIQESLVVQTSSTAPEEGKRSGVSCQLSLTEQHSFFLSPPSLAPHHNCSSTGPRTLAHLKHAVKHKVDHLRLTPLLAFTVVERRTYITTSELRG